MTAIWPLYFIFLVYTWVRVIMGLLIDLLGDANGKDPWEGDPKPFTASFKFGGLILLPLFFL